jgi:hydroxypyruvate isomerase
MRFSACIEMLFAAETPSFADRIRLARDAGLDGVEFWRWSNKDLDAIEAALRETGLPLTGLVAEPMVPLTDPACHDAFLAGLVDSVAVARRLGAPLLIAQTGNLLETLPRPAQRAALVSCLHRAADCLAGTGVVLAVEPLNTRVDHVGYFLSDTAEGLDIVDVVGQPEIRLLYDIYHAAVMDEAIEPALSGRLDRVAHVHLADTPGRGEPGSGALDWLDRLTWLQQAGYDDFVGLEYRPTRATAETLAPLRQFAA